MIIKACDDKIYRFYRDRKKKCDKCLDICEYFARFQLIFH